MKNGIKHKGLRIISIVTLLILLVFSASCPSDAAYFMGGKKSGSFDILCNLRENESAEIEFKIYEASEDGSFITITGFNELVDQTELRLMKVGGVWISEMVPKRIPIIVSKYGTPLNINEKGVNKLRCERKNDWFYVKLNGKVIHAVPIQDKLLTVSISVDTSVIEYRWTERNFKDSYDEQLMEVGAAKYTTSRIKHRIHNNETVRFSFKLIDVYQDRQWPSSIGVIIAGHRLWLSEKNNSFVISFENNLGHYVGDVKKLPIKKDWNTLDISRTGSYVTYTLNGKKVGKYIIRPRWVKDSDFYISFRVVGAKVLIKSEKTVTAFDKRKQINKWVDEKTLKSQLFQK